MVSEELEKKLSSSTDLNFLFYILSALSCYSESCHTKSLSINLNENSYKVILLKIKLSQDRNKNKTWIISICLCTTQIYNSSRFGKIMKNGSCTVDGKPYYTVSQIQSYILVQFYIQFSALEHLDNLGGIRSYTPPGVPGVNILDYINNPDGIRSYTTPGVRRKHIKTNKNHI